MASEASLTTDRSSSSTSCREGPRDGPLRMGERMLESSGRWRPGNVRWIVWEANAEAKELAWLGRVLALRGKGGDRMGGGTILLTQS